VHTHLYEVVFIDMGLDWSQIDILAPAFQYVEHLHLVKNHCSKISSQYQIPTEAFKLLKFINLEENGIQSWDEVVGFRTLPNLKRLTLNKNHIKSIYAKDGFRALDTLAINDNLLDSWTSFDQLNEFPNIKSLKASGNPYHNTGSQAGGARRNEGRKEEREIPG